MSSQIETLASKVESLLGERVKRVPSTCDEATFEVKAQDLLDVCTQLRDSAELKFEQLIDLTGLDYLDYGRNEWRTFDATESGFSRGVDCTGNIVKPSEAARFAVVYHLLSITNNVRLRVRCFCATADAPVLPSVVGIWAGANWYEREAFDLYGILFANHPDLRRILTDYGFIGYPFRKDFPLIGNVEVRYDPAKGRVIYQPVSIEPRTLVPRVIREDNRYEQPLKERRVADPT
jgi:NADH-quinone oxidoreductase subunit C